MTSEQTIITVPGDFPTIQGAIVSASTGDEIIVQPGTYVEAIDFLGKAITVRSSDPGDPSVVAATIIDATGLDSSVVKCVTSETSATVLDGFTITGGNAVVLPNIGGGGMSCNKSSPTVRNCVFDGNSARLGGGMFNSFSSPAVTNCTFSTNTSSGVGGGMFNISSSSPTVTNCAFDGNMGGSRGGGMFNGSSDPTLTNCTFSGNTAISGGGMYNISSGPEVVNCTFAGNIWILLRRSNVERLFLHSGACQLDLLG